MTYGYRFCWILSVSWVNILDEDKDFPINILSGLPTHPPNPPGFHGTHVLENWFSLFLHESKLFLTLFSLGCLHICQHKLLARFGETKLHKQNSLYWIRVTKVMKALVFLNFVFLLSDNSWLTFQTHSYFSLKPHAFACPCSGDPTCIPIFSCIYTDFEI